MLWTIERDSALRARVGTDSYAIIAGDLSRLWGHRISRNAVLGRAHRLGLSGMSAHRPHRQRKTNYTVAPRAGTVEPGSARKRRSILDLATEDCHWPVGELEAADFYFCGDQVAQDKSYCPHHCRLAYRRPGQREEQAA